MTAPALNACLNAASACFLAAGWTFIKKRRIGAHGACMLAAFLTSTVFLGNYLWYHWHAGHVRFQGTGPARLAYLAILGSHTVLAVAAVPLILRALFLAFRERFEEHRAWARWTLPVWLYVSVTGVVVYVMLYRL